MSEAVVAGCRAAEIFDDPASAALFAENEAECAIPMLSRVVPQRALYEQLEHVSAARCFAVRGDHGLCGYAFVLIAPSAHNGQRYATVESLFVKRDARPGGTGMRLMAAVEGAACSAGCEAVFYSAHAGSSLARILFLRSHQYVNTGHIFCRRLR